MDEIERIYKSYQKRDLESGDLQLPDTQYEKFKNAEREKVYAKILTRHFNKSYAELDFLEIGSGSGRNIGFFLNAGFKADRIWANELLPWRIKELKKLHSDIHIIEGDASKIDTSICYDVILQSLVFSSILDFEFKHLLAKKMLELLKPGGIIIWYDFIYNNPWNPEVQGISKKEIKWLFSGAEFKFWPVTLAPPIGRKIGKLYNFINGFCPLLRTHLVGEILF